MATNEHVVTQLEQEMITLKAQVSDQTGPADTVRTINNLGGRLSAVVEKN